MTLGKTITRGGVPVLQMPQACLEAMSWRQIANTQISGSPFTRSGQTNSLPGLVWAAEWSYDEFEFCDKRLGELRAFQAKLRGAGGRFFARDLTWKNCSYLGKTGSASRTVTLLACCVGDGLWPADNLWPATDVWPIDTVGANGFPEYTFAVTGGYNLDKPLIVAANASAGATTISIRPIESSYFFTVINPWDYADGVRPEYTEKLQAAKLEIYNQLGYKPEDGILKAGDWLQMDDQLRMVVEQVNEGDASITFEPPLVHPVSAGTAIDYKEPGVIMRLVDDNQVNWGATWKSHNAIGFKAIEVIR